MSKFLKTECPACSQHIEFPTELSGQHYPCPTCGNSFELRPSLSRAGKESARVAKNYFILGHSGPWGPFDWEKIREWLVRDYLPSHTQLSKNPSGPWIPAGNIGKWKHKPLIGLTRVVNDIPLQSELLPVSKALSDRLIFLGWPADPAGIGNYYWANKIREYLENVIQNEQRPLFNDPDWPQCWSWPCPAVEQKEAQEFAEKLRNVLKELSAYPPDPAKWGSWNEAVHNHPSQVRRQLRAYQVVRRWNWRVRRASEEIIDGFATTLDSCSCNEFERSRFPCKHIYCLAIVCNHAIPVTPEDYRRETWGLGDVNLDPHEESY